MRTISQTTRTPTFIEDLMISLLLLFSLSAFANSPLSSVPYEQLDPNNSYLANTKVAQDDFSIKALGGEKRVAEIRQQYDDQTRSYYLYEPYNTGDISTAMMRFNQIQAANQATYASAYDSVRKSQSSPYIDNLRAANSRGDISAPVQYTAVAAGVLTGNEIKTDVGSVKVSTSTNLYGQSGYVRVDAGYLGMKENVSANVSSGSQVCSMRVESDYGIVSAIVTPNASTDPSTAQATNVEFYQVSYSKTITGINFSTSYSGSTQVYKASVNRHIWKGISAQVDNSWGNESINMLPEVVGRITYSVKF